VTLTQSLDMDKDSTEPQLEWSSSFSLLPGEVAAASAVTGDKIILPQSALEQLLQASNARNNFVTRPLHPGYNFDSFYSNSSNGNADSHNQLPNPLIFRLVNPQNNKERFTPASASSPPQTKRSA